MRSVRQRDITDSAREAERPFKRLNDQQPLEDAPSLLIMRILLSCILRAWPFGPIVSLRDVSLRACYETGLLRQAAGDVCVQPHLEVILKKL